MSSMSENVDRLSYLPGEAVTHILSLMPTKYAVRTSILSKRWRYSWTLVTNFDFDDIHPVCDVDRFSKYVDDVLEHCKTSHIKLFRLCLSKMCVQKSSVSKWINEAVRLNVRELDIQCILLELPLSLFTCKTLTKLRLAVDRVTLEFSSSFKLPCLKILDINVYSIPWVSAFRLIHGCPVLESLSLQVTCCNDKEEYNFNIPTLKRLELRTTKCTSVINRVVLNVPNLEYLFVGGELCYLFVMEDVSSLIEATASFPNVTDNNLKAELLKGISGVKSLSWPTSLLDVLWNLAVPEFPNLKSLDLKSIPGWSSLFQFLENSSELEHLCINEPCYVIRHNPAAGSCWSEPKSVPTCILSNLRTMKVSKFMGRECGIQFLEYMLGHAKVLKTLTITCACQCLGEEERLCAQLLKFPRASKSCEIHFVGKWFQSTGN